MNMEKIQQVLTDFFPRAFSTSSPFLQNPDAKRILERVLEMSSNPINLTHFNQLLHLNHEAGVSSGFFEYYFLKCPEQHPYRVDKVVTPTPGLDEKGISSYGQLDFGFRRFYIDALLYWGDIRSAFRTLRSLSLEQIEALYRAKRYPSEEMRRRSKVLPFRKIQIDDRYLISEIACKAFSDEKLDNVIPVQEKLIEAYRKRGGGRLAIKALFEDGGDISNGDPQDQLILELGAEELMETTVEDEDDIKSRFGKIVERFRAARQAAEENTSLYLSIVNELDIYIATSMRKRDDFRNMARDCSEIFGNEGLRRFQLRYFDPTMSAAKRHEDKGLIECLMVKCAKTVLYFAGETDSFGKDSEVAMALSLGKPVIILCPETKKGAQRAKMFRDIHPLARLIHFETGVAIGSIVTQDKKIASKLLDRIFDNNMEYDFEHNGDGYFRLRERLTGSVVRLQTNSRMLRETFWNYYRNVP